MPAYALGRITDAARFVEAADQLVSAAPDDHLADWLDAIAWLCWTETMMGRYDSALAHFDRAVAIARSTGQGYVISNLLAGQAQVLVMFGRLEEASAAAEEAAEVARLLGSELPARLRARPAVPGAEPGPAIVRRPCGWVRRRRGPARETGNGRARRPSTRWRSR